MPRERFRIHDQAAAEVREAITWFAKRDEKLVEHLIHVIAVAHTSRLPGYWKSRLRDIWDA